MIDSSWKFLSSFEDFPTGAIRHIRLPAGLELVFCNFRCDRNARHIFTLDNAPIEFAFHLAGHGDGEIIHTPWRREVVTAGPETAIFSFNPESVCRISIGEKQTLRVVNIYLSTDRLRRMFEDEPDHLPRDLRRILDAPIPRPCNNVRPLHPRCRVILDQIYNCRYRGAFRRLYILRARPWNCWFCNWKPGNTTRLELVMPRMAAKVAFCSSRCAFSLS
jgi:hypothetical protein